MTIAKVLLSIAVCFAMSINYSCAEGGKKENGWGVSYLCREYNENIQAPGDNVDPECCNHECNAVIKPGEKKYGLENTSTQTRRHCSCDAVIYECLTFRKNAAYTTFDNVCFYPKGCPAGELCEVEEYEWRTQHVNVPLGHGNEYNRIDLNDKH